MPDPRAALAVLTSRALTTGIRRLGRGGGTALPGLVANRIDPRLLDKLAARLPAGAIVVAGTNGKTTTSRMLADMLAHSGRKVAHNRSGSNLVRGISSAFAEQLGPFGGGSAEIGVIESDENALPEVLRRVRPRVVLLLNLFRDQLDRYGELETIAAHWRAPLAALGPDCTLVVNADDPNLAWLASASGARVVTFGFEEAGQQLSGLPHAADAGVCRVCESRLVYDALYVSHLGAYHCPNCGFKRPRLLLAGRDVELRGVDALRLTIEDRRGQAESQRVEVALPGMYNAYNALAAAAAARALGLPFETLSAGLRGFTAAFGRLERVTYRGRPLTLALAKNPTGFNEILRMLAAEPLDGGLAIGINDLDADGRDVSWLWDVDFEALADPRHTARLFAIGLRGADLAVRLKYAGVPAERLDASGAGQPLGAALERLVEAVEPGGRLFLLLTYTALLELRQALADRGAVAQFWEQ
jgi:UDP-N-acetylmuramyl tripeptide synthase